MFKAYALAFAMLVVAGCSSVGSALTKHGMAWPTYEGTFLPSGSFNLSPSYSITYANLILVAGTVAVVYLVVDPRSPAWEITETRFPDRRVQYSLKMKHFNNGGDGEARQVLQRRAAALAQEEGMTGYQIKRYSESIESRIWLPRRMVEADITMLYVDPSEKKPTEPRPPLALK